LPRRYSIINKKIILADSSDTLGYSDNHELKTAAGTRDTLDIEIIEAFEKEKDILYHCADTDFCMLSHDPLIPLRYGIIVIY
jgi:hypothetical protein